MALIDAFIKLSGIDDRRIAVERKLANAPRAAKEADGKAKEAKDALQKFKEDAKRAGLELKRLEAEAKAQTAEIEKTQINQNQAKGNEEFKLLGKKVDGLKEALGIIETKILEEYERIDRRGPDQAALEAKEKAALAEAAALNKAAEAEIATLKADLAKIEAERKAALEGVDKQALAMYREALERHGDRAIASVASSSCQGCFTSVRPNQISLLKSREQILTCFECGRILFLEGA